MMSASIRQYIGPSGPSRKVEVTGDRLILPTPPFAAADGDDMLTPWIRGMTGRSAGVGHRHLDPVAAAVGRDLNGHAADAFHGDSRSFTFVLDALRNWMDPRVMTLQRHVRHLCCWRS